jgi:hypothetical protein
MILIAERLGGCQNFSPRYATVPTCLKKFPQILFVVLGCLHLLGGPYSMLQVYAWATMLVDYSRDDGLLQAARDTFSGEKPCELCCIVKSARDNEPEEDAPASPASRLAAKPFHDMLPLGEMVIQPPAATEVPNLGFFELVVSSGIGPAAPPCPPPWRVG